MTPDDYDEQTGAEAMREPDPMLETGNEERDERMAQWSADRRANLGVEE